MNVKDILTAWLIKYEYDGLCCEDCGCELSDLFPCGEDFSGCEPGYKRPCIPEECEADGDCEFHIGTEKPKETP